MLELRKRRDMPRSAGWREWDPPSQSLRRDGLYATYGIQKQNASAQAGVFCWLAEYLVVDGSVAYFSDGS
jgi:hypothetical protein